MSGGHANPAVTIGLLFTRFVSPLRCIMYVFAQCGGGIAGAALVLGVKGKSNDPVIRMNPDPEGSGGSGGSGGEFGMEFVLTFIVVYAFCASRDARYVSECMRSGQGEELVEEYTEA